MADIAYECADCDSTRMVSEFADPEKIRCTACGSTMYKQGSKPAKVTKDKDLDNTGAEQANTTKASRLKLARPTPPPPADEPPGEVKSVKELEPEKKRAPLELHPKIKKKRPMVSQPVLALLLFVVIGGISGFLRFGGRIPPEQLEPIMEYAWVGVLALQILIVLKALSLDMMQGVLCIFIPGYSIIFLGMSDQFFHKAIIFGLLVGIGLDGGFQLIEFWMIGFNAVQNFINSGGGS
jgi:DNA-directed RNA polymerase subunit RPC12/RpoP